MLYGAALGGVCRLSRIVLVFQKNEAAVFLCGAGLFSFAFRRIHASVTDVEWRVGSRHQAVLVDAADEHPLHRDYL